MADITATLQNMQLLQLTVVDNGDGTFSLKTTGGTGGSSGSGVTSGALTSRSGTVTAGGTRQQLMAANPTRKYLLIQNQSVGALYIRFTGNAAADNTGLKLEAGGAYESNGAFCSNQAVDVYGATTGQAWFAVEG